MMKKYDDFKKDKAALYLTKEEMAAVKWTKYVIVVPTEEDRSELMEAFEHIHYSDIDTDNIAVNQLAHEYLDDDREPGTYNNIVVDPAAYEKLRSTVKKKYNKK